MKNDIDQALVRLLGPLTDWLDIRRLYLDRSLYEVRVLQALEAFKLEYVVRARRFPSLAEGPAATTVEEDSEMGGSRPPSGPVTVTRFAVPHAHKPDKQTYFVTNVSVPETTASGRDGFTHAVNSGIPASKYSSFSAVPRPAFYRDQRSLME